jgi:PDZ domain-containing protein
MVTPAEPDAHGPGGRAPDVPDRGDPAPEPGDAAPGTAADDGGRAVAPPAGNGDAPPPVPPPPSAPITRGRRASTRSVVAAVVAFLVVAFAVGAYFIPLPYYLFKPGSVRDTEPLITIRGAEVYESEGSINYTTVSLRQATLVGLFWGWLDDDVDIVDRDRVLQGRDVEENRQVNLQMMSDSKDVATQVALERLGYDVDITVGHVVVGVEDGAPADGVLRPGETIVAVDGERFDDTEDMSRLLAAHAPGDRVRVTVEGAAGTERDETLRLAPAPDDPDRGIMGVQVVSTVLEYDFPIEVEIDTGKVGGPSAGLAFTLALIDVLTPGDLTGGEDVAVTGTIASDGTVGQVGGTGQKAAAAREKGMSLFLVPSADYEEAVAHAGDDLEVVAVDSLEEALAVLAEHGGNVDELPEVGEAAAAPVG